MEVRIYPFDNMNDLDYFNVPYFKINQDCSTEEFVKKWINFCAKNDYELTVVKPKMGWLNEDFENFKITVIAERV